MMHIRSPASNGAGTDAKETYVRIGDVGEVWVHSIVDASGLLALIMVQATSQKGEIDYRTKSRLAEKHL